MANNLEMGMRGQFLLDVLAERNSEKESLRAKLEKDVAEFERNGGKIEELPGVGNVPRQAPKNIEPYPSRPKKNPYVSFKYNVLLREWCAVTVGRLKELSRRSGYSEAWFSIRCSGRYQFRFVEYEHVQPFMDDIEQMETDLKLKKITQKYAGETNEEEN